LRRRNECYGGEEMVRRKKDVREESRWLERGRDGWEERRLNS
jgi:hypothetical protein